jgi:hypothetical protein
MARKPVQEVFPIGDKTGFIGSTSLGDLKKAGFVFLRAESKLLKVVKATGKPGVGKVHYQRQTRLWFKAPKSLLGI